MTKEDAKAILNSRTLIDEARKYTVKVDTCGDFHKELSRGHQVAIANFNAMTPYGFSEAKKLYLAGDFQDALNQNMSLSIRDTDYRPAKGEIVDITIVQKLNKAGELAFFVASLTPIKAIAGKAISVDSWDEVPAEASEAGDEA